MGRVVVTFLLAACVLVAIGFLSTSAVSPEPASSVKTPNPSKAPWYRLSVAGLIVYGDPYYAGLLSRLPVPIQYVLMTPVMIVMPIAFVSFFAVVFACLAGARRRTKHELILETK